MDSPVEEWNPIFWIGQHDSKRVRVTPEVLEQAHACNYDMLTSPITTPSFHTRVLTLVSNHIAELEGNPGTDLSVPTVPSLSPVDTPLAPGNTISHLLAVVSPWIDLCSPDPMVYSVSRQVLEMEVAYAAFCGIGNIILPGPKLHHGKLHGDGVTQYAYAVQEALKIAQYIQLSVMLPMMADSEQDSDEVEGSLAKEARAIYMGLSEGHSHKDSMEPTRGTVRASDQNDDGASVRRKKSARFDFFGTWDAWNVIRTLCTYNARLFVALSVPSHLPPLSVRSRWHSEPLRLICFSESTFYHNPKGYPAFTHSHQELLTQYMRIRNAPWILLTDVGPILEPDKPEPSTTVADGWQPSGGAAGSSSFAPAPAEASQIWRQDSKKSDNLGPTPHLDYLRNLQRKQPPKTMLQRFGAGYQDYLQSPLQPLTDNLESITYEVFEKDPIKYDLYYQAIAQALIDWREQGKPASGPEGRIVVAVVGAGRGPLVTKALLASESEGVPIDMWAVEKNPNAFVLLQRRNEETWGNCVNLVKSDMRSWKGPLRGRAAQPSGYTGHWPPPRENQFSIAASTTAQIPTHGPIDILISELLGSFADNELSPECLDGILPLLNPTHGISIPASYTAYLTPIAAPKLHADILTRTITDKEAHNTPYVVMLHAIDYLSITSRPNTASSTTDSSSIPIPVPNILPVWSFSHGPMEPLTTSSENSHNTRQARLNFNLRDQAVCHGLAGYFEATLYPGVELSTNPLNMNEKSPAMMSWFPIFFPLKTPIYTPDASTLTVNIFRATDNRKVWYEWMVEAWSNLMGGGVGSGAEKRKIRLGVSEVGSSKKGGCMM
ncbi:MAG: methyltransferase protein [Alectoria fallacina]|uniref:Protein arginine N-methyltransferase n=1 Tax=Alectoria fallacina TaxID=1903189 RepID=A0A8H3J2U9_9LECA|nr:MAG: methyltransferase protein [Alectoria fallacina]